MKKYILLLLSVLNILLLFAQQDLNNIKQSQEYLQIMPDDLTERLNLAYLYMLNNSPDSALAEYQRVLDKESDHLEAWIGYLWALSVLDNNRELLNKGQLALQKTNNNPSILTFMGSASLNLYNIYSSRYYYNKALQDSTIGLFDRFYALKGLGVNYYWMHDYSKYKKINHSINMNLPDTLKANLVPFKPYYYTGIFYGQSGSNTSFKGVEQYVDFKAADFHFIVENFQNDHKNVRTNYSLKTNNYYFPISIASQFHFIDGQSPWYYDAKIYQIALFRDFYWWKTKIEPYVAYTYNDYSNFHAEQKDFGFQLNSDVVTISSINSLIRYEDYPAYYLTDKVKDKYMHYYSSVLFKLMDTMDAEISSGFGNQSFWVSPSAFVIDTNQGADQYHQLSLYFYFPKLMISSYYKQAHKNNHWTGTGMISVGMRY